MFLVTVVFIVNELLMQISFLQALTTDEVASVDD